MVFNHVKTDVEDKIKYIALEDFDRFVPQYILFQLYLQDIQSVIIEGGAHTLNTFINDGLWDEARIFTGPSVLNNGIKAPLVSGANGGECIIGADSLKIFYKQPK